MIDTSIPQLQLKQTSMCMNDAASELPGAVPTEPAAGVCVVVYMGLQ